MSSPPDPKLLSKLEKTIKKEGKEGGLTDSQLGKNKNKHWNHVYTSGVWAFRILLVFFCLWIFILLSYYLFTIINDPEYLKQIVENFIWGSIIVLATFGGKTILGKFFKTEI